MWWWETCGAVPTGWRAVHAGGRLQQPAGPPRWCIESSSTRSPSPEPTWCLRSPATGRWWYSHTTTAAARSRTAPGAGCDYARVQPHTAGKRQSQRPSTSSLPRLEPPRILPAVFPVRLHLNAGRVIFLQKIRESKHLDSRPPQHDAQQHPLRFLLQGLECSVNVCRNVIAWLPLTHLKNKSHWWSQCCFINATNATDISVEARQCDEKKRFCKLL